MSRRGDVLRTVAITLVAAVAIVLVRGSLYERHRKVHDGVDVYTLPPPEDVVRLSLGYRSALADLIWSNVLVAQGTHTEQHLRYDNVTKLIETVVTLDPQFKDPYLFAESLIVFQVSQAQLDDVKKVRELLERGVQARPMDGELWLALGEFVAYVAPGTYLTDPAEQAAWRLDGARALARAGEIGGDAAAWQALGGASILSTAGERDAAVRFLERTLAVTDDPELQDSIRAHLRRLKSEQAEEAVRRFNDVLLAERHADLPFVSRTQFVVLGPPRDAAACAGPEQIWEPACLGTWREREQHLNEAADALKALSELTRVRRPEPVGAP